MSPSRSVLTPTVLMLALSTPLLADDVTIELFQAAFLPQVVTIDLGDTVTWQWVAGTHTITSGLPNGAPGSPEEPGAIFEATVDQANPTFTYTFTEYQASGYSFFDADNPNQTGFVQLATDEQEFLVLVVDNAFIPITLHIFEGDSIRWEHDPNEMLHTVTSGASSAPQDDPGVLFDEISSDADPIFVYEFANAGEYPYFCRPHEILGMNGTILVQERFIRGDTDRDGTSSVSDVTTLVDYLFAGGSVSCVDALDCDDDGKVNLTDVVVLAHYVFASGVEPAPPFPQEGPDRTDDSLLCGAP